MMLIIPRFRMYSVFTNSKVSGELYILNIMSLGQKNVFIQISKSP